GETIPAQVFLYHREDRSVVMVSHSKGTPTVPANDAATRASISADGRFVAYSSRATDLVYRYSPNSVRYRNVFLYSVEDGASELVSHGVGPRLPPGHKVSGGNDDSDDVFFGVDMSDYPHALSISADGSTVAFESKAWNLVVDYQPSSGS